MKSNFKKKLEDQRQNGSENKGTSKQFRNIELIQIIKPYVQKDFDDAVKEFGEEATIIILQQMLSLRYLKGFQPQTPEVKNTVKNCVSGLVVRLTKNKLAESLKIDEISTKTDEQLLAEFEILKSIKKSIGKTAKTGVDSIITKYSQEIHTREKEARQKEIDERKKKIAEARKIEEAKLAEQKEKAEEVSYYETVQKFTKNFEFLAESEETFFTKIGGRNMAKFPNLEQYFRFAHLKFILNTNMEKGDISERQAIINVLSDKNQQLKVADRKILLERQNVLEKEMAKEER